MRLKRAFYGVVLGAALSCMVWSAPVLPAQAATKAEETEEISVDRKQIPVYRKSMKDKEKVECLFYEDIPNVPYISVTTFAKTFYNIDMISKEKNGVFTLTRKKVDSKDGKGKIAKVDVNKDTFVTDDYSNFIDPIALVEKGTSDGDIPYIKEDKKASVATGTAKKKTLDFGKDGIDLRETDGVLYAPLSTLSDMYTASTAITVYYNGEKIYFDSLLDTEILDVGHARSKDKKMLGTLGESKIRSKDMAEFTYKELCFVIDNFYGFPCTKNAFHDYIRKNGFDAALKKYDKELRGMLLSTDREKYMVGMARLFIYWMNDGGHTGIVLEPQLENYPKLSKQIGNAVSEDDPQTKYKFTYYEKMMSHSITEEIIKVTRKMAFKDTETYHEIGDTAIIRFDEFVTDSEAWRKFYKGKGEMPADPSKDTFGYLQSCLQKVKKNPEIRNIVIDLTTNSGGEEEALASVEDLLMGGNEVQILDEATGVKRSTVFKVDRNMDGKFDSKDKKVTFKDYNIAVLTSVCSFSSANALPAYAKDNGFMVLGVPSGGGACSISVRATADGLNYQISSENMVVCNSLDSIDDGIPVDALLSKKTGVTYNYSTLFDTVEMSRQIHKFYKDYKKEWVSGYWYDENSVMDKKHTGSWITDGTETRYQVKDQGVLKDQWAKIDGEKYYFDENGNMVKAEYRNGYWLDRNGKKTGRAKHTWKKEGGSWKYVDTKGTCLKNRWQKIDGKWYFFDQEGNMAANAWVRGYWVGKNGAWVYPYKGSWKKVNGSWRYGDTSGWTAKNGTYTINGKKYNFNATGICLNP